MKYLALLQKNLIIVIPINQYECEISKSYDFAPNLSNGISNDGQFTIEKDI